MGEPEQAFTATPSTIDEDQGAYPEGVPLLLTLLKDVRGKIRRVAVTILAQAANKGDHEVLEALKEHLVDEEEYADADMKQMKEVVDETLEALKETVVTKS